MKLTGASGVTLLRPTLDSFASLGWCPGFWETPPAIGNSLPSEAACFSWIAFIATMRFFSFLSYLTTNAQSLHYSNLGISLPQCHHIGNLQSPETFPGCQWENCVGITRGWMREAQDWEMRQAPSRGADWARLGKWGPARQMAQGVRGGRYEGVTASVASSVEPKNKASVVNLLVKK